MKKVTNIKKIEDYFNKHAYYNSLVHLGLGIGVGILITYPMVGTHPLRWGAVFVGLAVLGHLYPMWR